jgi:alkyldihydroxyacetonephosphate synthase
MCHLSHSYRDGASLYFTCIFPRALGDEFAQWRAIKNAATNAIMENGGTLSHHHGVGEDHLPWMVREKGELGLDVLRAIKRALDPAGILNPGKLIPS